MTMKIKVKVTEELFSKGEVEGVVAELMDGKVERIALTWFVKTVNGSGWQEFELPKGEAQLIRLRVAIDDILKQIEESKRRLDWSEVCVKTEG